MSRTTKGLEVTPEAKAKALRDAVRNTGVQFGRPAAESASCPCECHKVQHEARKPHPKTMAGR